MPDDNNNAVPPAKPSSEAWTFDVQRGLTWVIIGTFALVVNVMMLRTIFSAGVDDVIDIFKVSLAVLNNIVMIAVGYWLGSSKSSQTKDEQQNKIVERAMSNSPPAAPLTPDQIAEATLSNGQRTYYGTITDPEQKKKFLGMSDAERNAVIGKA